MEDMQEMQEGERLDMPILQNDMEAEEHMEKIRYWNDYEDRMVKHFEEQIKLVREKAEARRAYHKHLLYDYFARVPHNSTKTQESYPLRSGKIVMKRATEKLVQPKDDDEKMFLLYLAENGIKGFSKTKVEEHLDWINYKKRLSIIDGQAVDKETGEIVDGIRVEKVEASFDVALNKDEKENSNGTEDQAS